MSSKTKRPSGGSTYSSNRKRHIRDLSVSSHDDQEKSASEKHASDNETDGKKKTDKSKEKPSSSKLAEDGDLPVPDEQEESEEEKEFEVETIKRHRYQGKSVQYLVGWKGYPSEDDSWEPPKHLTGALELVKRYRIEHNLDSKPKSGRASNTSAKASSKKSEKTLDLSEASGEDDARTSRKRKRLSEVKPKSTIAPLRKNGISGPTKADRASVANRKSVQRDSDASEEDVESVDEDEWHARYKKLASWEDLIRSVRTIEKPGLEDDEEKSPSTSSDPINVCLLWNTGRTTWVSNKTARAKLPLKLLDFYEAHLQFSTSEH